MAGAWAGERTAVLIAGEARIGQVAPLRATAAHAADRGVTVAWGGCSDVGDAPGYWPWTQLFGALVRAVGPDRARELANADAPLLGTTVPALGRPIAGEDSGRAQLLLMDATVRWLSGLTTDGPVLVILDDLQWADESSVRLLDFVARASHLSGLCVLGAYRGDDGQLVAGISVTPTAAWRARGAAAGLPWARRSVAVREQLDHPIGLAADRGALAGLAADRGALAGLLVDAGDLDEAVELLDAAREVFVVHLGEDD